MNHDKLFKLVDKFKEQSVLVIGDLMLDRTVRGKVNRISPEAPVPVVEIASEFQTPGGAGNVVANITALGGKAILVSVVGRDASGAALKEEFRDRGIETGGIFEDSDRPTTTKTRIVAEQQQVVRIDVERKTPLASGLRTRILDYIKNVIGQTRCIVISDYGKGVIYQPLLGDILALARKHAKNIVVDPKVEHFFAYRGVDCITPNMKEAVEGMRTLSPKSDSEINELGRQILRKLRCRSVLITRGEKGMSLFEHGRPPEHIPTMAKEVFDVTGAGDTVVSVFALARASGVSHINAAILANYAAGIVVGKFGTATVTPEELKKAIKRL